MGCRMGDSSSEQLPIAPPPQSPPSNDESAFLYAIFCLIGLPVDVRVRNGSLFSGIFHTASVEGVILKKARLIKKGKTDTNVSVGCTIETLVIFSGDLVQVVAKGEGVPASGDGGNSDNDEFGGTMAASQTAAKGSKNVQGFTIFRNNPFHKSASAVQSDDRLVNGMNDMAAKHVKKTNNNIPKEEIKTFPNAVGVIFPEEIKTDQMILDQEASSTPQIERNVQDVKVQREDVSCCGVSNTDSDKIITASGNGNSSASDDSRLVNVKSVKGMNSAGQLQPHGGNHGTSAASINSDQGTCHRPISSDGATNSTTSALCSAPSADTSFDPCRSSTKSPVDKVHFQPTEANKIAKGSKLNPGAKIFSPSYVPTLPTSPPLVQDAGGINYIPGSSPLLPVTVQADVGMGTFIPQAALANKVFPYGDLSTGNGDSNALPQPMVGNLGSRTPLLSYGGQQQAIQTGSPYVNPNPQAVMVGRPGQPVYMPVSQVWAYFPNSKHTF
ncbi:hypothetical protein MLD38_035270 [Melastoma candidum]|uniref:Uncharacterized protein n=1 Tax=Melastoma candidum TaxID=119954 RepID=A0ACB9MEI4_9MYRT|nr:hypothetical protein MLD38_035270 [Melastoma candidum]